MKNREINILFIADIVGKAGFEITAKLIGNLKHKYHINFCIANGENSAAGRGITEKIVRQFFSIGIDVLTSGNHIWENHGITNLLNNNPRVLRPLNYPSSNAGKGSLLESITDELKIAVINLQGRTFMYPIDCPFRTASEEIEKLRKETNIIIVDFHAEATAEKMALAWYLDGKVSALIGTHTHVQTADERILPNGMAYITDVGMTGAFDSVIGMKKEIALKRFLNQIPVKYRPADQNLKLCGVVISIDTVSGRATKIERLMYP